MRKIFLVLILGTFQLSAQASDWSGVRYLEDQNALWSLRANDLQTPKLEPIYQQIYQSVSQEKLQTVLKQMTGVVPVTVNGVTFSITDRYLPASKAKFRAFWLDYFQKLGITAKELPFDTRHHIGERQGHNLEAVLPGKSKNTVIVVVHYDSTGPGGDEAGNPAVDDDMTGMSTLMETARILAAHRNELQNTIRFVGVDYEEHSLPGLEGSRQYVKYLKNLAQAEGFKILAAVDNEQSGWNCIGEKACSGGDKPIVDIFSCSGDFKGHDYKELGDSLERIVAQFASKLEPSRGCIGENSDHYAFWEIGVPAVVFSEHNPFSNPHFDGAGGDTYEKIDQNYFFSIAQVGVTFAATLAGLKP